MPRPSPVPGWVPDDLPPAPGVYQFEDTGGHALYVGKSVNLRRRVRSYFYGGRPDDDRIAEMLRASRSVRFRRTGTDLEARLEEADRILRRRPPYNRALKRQWRGWYLEIPWRDPFPRIRLVRSSGRSGSRYFGPFRGRKLPDRIRRLTEKLFRLRSCSGRILPDVSGTACIQRELGLCSAPCVREAPLERYRAQVREAERLLADAGFGQRLRRRWIRERDRAAAALAFEDAAALQRRLEWLDELEERRQPLDASTPEGSWLLGLPGAGRGRRVLVPVARGRVLARHDVVWEEGIWEAAVEDACYRIRVAELRSPAVLPPGERVLSLIVARWLEEGAAGGTAVDLSRADARDAIRRLREA